MPRQRNCVQRTVAISVLLATVDYVSCQAKQLKILIGHVEESGVVSVSDAPTNENGRVILINKSMDANFTQYIPCVDDLRGTDNSLFLPTKRKLTRTPVFTSLSCAPAQSKCFRAVYDGFDDLSLLTQTLSDESMLEERIQAVVKSLIVANDGTLLPAKIEKSYLRNKTYDTDNTKANYGETHVDYFESEIFVYTVVLYGEPSNNLLGGETFIADAQNGFRFIDGITDRSSNRSANERRPKELTSGIIVEPKLGRLLIFTGGGENVHGPLQVFEGERHTKHLWFRCDQS